ncbi:TPA: hypothetical protein RQL16_000383 [Vibrio vulnificus]|nr:hypothetical protein [Vibrio vulnificus]HDY8216591.1 hypothetical protein [Vibrio vulnificus]
MSQELVNSVNKLTDETSALLQEYVKGNTVLQNSASEAASSAAAAKVSEGITIDKANVATQKAAEAKQFRDETAAVATGGTATLEPTPGKIPLANAEAKLHAGWLPVNVSALSEAIVEAIRDVNKEQYAASGFIHDGKHFNSGNLSSVNEGMTVDIGTPNVIYLGARDGVTGSGLGGTSATNYPVMNVAGFEVHLQGINASLTNLHANTIKLPEAPNGTVIYDSSGNCRGTGKPTLDLSKEVDPKYGDVASSVNEAVARAFEGMIKNGDFRKGNSDWNQSLLTVNQGKASISGTNNNLGIGNNSAFQCIGGKEYEVEVVCAEWRSGNISFANNSLVHRPLIVDGAGVFKARFSASSSDPRYFFWLSNADMDITSFSFKPVTEEVVINRVDMAGLEFFKRKVGEYLYPYGSPQCGYTEVDGVPTTEDTSRPITYFAAYDGDTTSRGRGWRLVDLTFAQLAVIMSNPKHNAWYNEKGELLQFGPRQRSFAGVGNGDWLNINCMVNPLRPVSVVDIAPQGMSDTVSGSGSTWYAQVGSQYNKSPDAGVFTVPAANTTTAVDGECYFYVLATVPRLNTAAYNNANFMGSSKFSDNKFWHDSAAAKLSIKDAFSNASLDQSVSGRDDGKKAQFIYQSGQGGVIDRRLPARDMSGKEEAAKVIQKVVNGTYRGLEELMCTEFFTVISKQVLGGTTGRVTLSREVRLSSIYPEFTTQDTSNLDSSGWSVWVNGVEYAVDWSNAGRPNETTCQFDKYSAGSFWDSVPVGAKVYVSRNGNKMMQHRLSGISVSGDFNTLDVVGPPDKILADSSLANGWLGNWGGFKQEATTELVRKSLLASAKRLYKGTADWTSQADAPVNQTTNSTGLSYGDTELVMFNYTAFANQTKRSSNKPVLNGSEGVGSTMLVQGNSVGYGALVGESLLGKVITNDAAGHAPTDLGEAYGYYLTNSGSIGTGGGSLNPPRHQPIMALAPTNNSPAVKVLWHQASNYQQATLNFLWNEMVFDTNWRTPDKVWSGGSVSVAAGEMFRAESSSAYAVAGLLMRCVKAVTANATVLGAMHVSVGGEVISLTDGQTYFKVVNNGWSDDSTIRIIDGVGTFNNENGDTCLYGTDELAMPYGYTKNQAGPGKQVVGVDL